MSLLRSTASLKARYSPERWNEYGVCRWLLSVSRSTPPVPLDRCQYRFGTPDGVRTEANAMRVPSGVHTGAKSGPFSNVNFVRSRSGS